MAKTKKTRKTKVKKTKVKIIKWVCPDEKVFLLKPETLLLAAFVFLVFIFSFATFDQQWLPTAIATVLFIIIFLLVTHLFRFLYPVRTFYQISTKGFSIQHQAGKKINKAFLNFREIKNIKIDRFLHGGHLETNDKRHHLYFNSKKEIERLENYLLGKIKREEKLVRREDNKKRR